MLAAVLIRGSAYAQSPAPGVTADLQSLVGHYHATQNFSDRTVSSLIGNIYMPNGWSTHAEATYLTREETAGFFAGGLSYNLPQFSIKALAGSSTDNQMILPEIYGRVEAAFRSSPEVGLVVAPAVTYREYRNTAYETALETQVLKYHGLGGGASLIFSGLGRATAVEPGHHWVGSGGVGLTYAEYQRYSVGLSFEAGRSSYNSLLGPGTANLPYYTIRPHASIYLYERLELFGSVEYTDLDSYKVYGGLAGIKMRFN